MPAGERWSWNNDIIVDGNINKCGNYALNDGTKVKIMPVNHPSVGYSWDYWHKLITAFLILLLLHPINTLDVRYLAKVPDVMSNNR